MRVVPVFSAVALLVTPLLALCPVPGQLPNLTSNGMPLCARLYRNTHHTVKLSCQGASRDVMAGVQMRHLRRYWDNTVSAMVVHHGCSIKVYSGKNFYGSRREFVAGRHHDLRKYRRGFWLWHNWHDTISSLICTCSPSTLTNAMKKPRDPQADSTD